MWFERVMNAKRSVCVCQVLCMFFFFVHEPAELSLVKTNNTKNNDKTSTNNEKKGSV